MDRFVLDTSIILHYIRNSKIFQQIEEENNLTYSDSTILISAITVGEIQGFVIRNNWGKDKIKRMNDLLEKIVIVDISGKDQKLMEAYSNLWNFSKNNHPTEKLGKSIGIGQNDIWIASLALITDSTLITTDSDFDHLSPKWIKLLKYESN